MEAQKTNDTTVGEYLDSEGTVSCGEKKEKDREAGKEETVLSSEDQNSEIYESVEYVKLPQTDESGYLVPRPEERIETRKETDGQVPSNNEQVQPPSIASVKVHPREGDKEGREVSTKSGVLSMYEDLWSFRQNVNPGNREATDKANEHHPVISQSSTGDDPIYDEVDTVISGAMRGAKIIPIEEPPSAYDEVIINEGRYIIPSTTWDSDSDVWESDFDDEDAPSYFGDNLEKLYETMENRRIASPVGKGVSGQESFDSYENVPKSKTLPGLQQVLRSCLPVPFSRKSKEIDATSDDVDSPLYVDPNNVGTAQPVMPPISLALSAEEMARYRIVNKILDSEDTYMKKLNQLVEIEEGLRERNLLETEELDVIFCSLQDILQCHEMFNKELAARMNEWTVSDKLGDVICGSFSKSTTLVAYTDFVNNFPTAIDTYRAARKNYVVFAQFLQAKEKSFDRKTSFHDVMLKPFERFPQFISLIQDLLEVTPVRHSDRVPLQLALTQLECLAETINLRRIETEMKNRVKCLDAQISQLSKPLSSSGRLFIRQDDMVHCLIDGASVVGTKKLRLVLLSDMLLCLSPIGKKKNIVSGLLNASKFKYKLKWNVPLPDVQFVEYGSGVSVAAGKYGTTTTYSDQGKYRQATVEIQEHIEDLQHDLAVIGQIIGLTSSLRGKHELIDQQKVEKWYKSVENTINEELKTVNMFWLEISLPTRSGQQNYVFNLSSPTVKEEWESATRTAKLALETRNNPGWYLPEDGITGGVSILRRNMPLLAEFFDLFIFSSKSRVEQTLTYPMDVSITPTAAGSRGLGHYIWISARGDLQGHVTTLQIERNSSVPRFVESFSVCPGTVYSMARIPAMNSRPDQRPDKYNSKYGFPFPTVWLGSHSSRIYIYRCRSDDRSEPVMEIKLRDAPLDMKFANKKIYVGLANGTLAIFKSNSSQHWNLVQPSILPLGRYPVAVIADVNDKLWCGSGSQIYIVNKNGDRIHRIIAADSNMKNLVKHIVYYGVGVWVSIWRKATIKLYHAETFEMMQEVNIVSPVMKMKNDVDSQVQYLAVDKITVTALLVTPGFLWVGTSFGLILVYPLPKLQGVPRVVGRACVAFHAHCGPVRSLLAVPEGTFHPQTAIDDNLTSSVSGENANETARQLNQLADSDESVESDEDFFFVDDRKRDTKRTSPEKKNSIINTGKFKVTLKKPGERGVKSESTKSEPRLDISDVDSIKVNDFAVIMEAFDGFSSPAKDESLSAENVKDRKKVKSFKNRLFAATYPEDSKENESGPEIAMVPLPGNPDLSDTNIPPGQDTSWEENSLADDNNDKPDKSTRTDEMIEGNVVSSEKHPVLDEETIPGAQPTEDSETADSVVSGENTKSEKGTSLECDESSVAKGSNAQNSKLNLVNGDTLCGQIPSSSEVQMAGIDEIPENGDFPTDVEPIYVNLPRNNVSKVSDDSPEKLSRENEVEKTALVDDNGQQSASTPESSVEPTEPCKTPTTNENRVENEDGKTSPVSPVPGKSPQELYTVVLPNEQEPGPDAVKPKATKDQVETGPESLVEPSTKSSPRCLSYLVISAGEGHVDLRMKLKSKNEIKKDMQTRLLIWRVNGKA